MQAQSKCKSETYLARQPVLNADGRVVAYELLFRATLANHANVVNAAQSTMSVIETALGEMGISQSLKGKDCFLNCPDEVFRSPMLNVLPPHRFVLEILESSDFSKDVYADCSRLKKLGFRIALDDVTAYTPNLSKMLPITDIVKVDWINTKPDEKTGLCHLLKQSGSIVLAEKIETWEDFREAAKAGACLFQGYYFSQPEMLRSPTLLPHFTAVLEVMRMLLEDEPVSRLCSALEHTPALLVQLLRLASSGYTSRRHPCRVASVHDALTIVGTSKLMQWCSLLLYVDRLPVYDDPLMSLAAQRSEIMGQYIRLHHPSNELLHRKAKLAGSLSLLHVSYDCAPGEFWMNMGLDDEICNAILMECGPVGSALAFAKEFEGKVFN